MSTWRHVRAVLLLPGVVTVLVPALIVWLTSEVGVGWGLPDGLALGPILLGVALIGLGLTLVASTVRLFVTVGRGKLAPWDPT